MRETARKIASTVLGGTVHPDIENKIKDTIETTVTVGFEKFVKWIGEQKPGTNGRSKR